MALILLVLLSILLHFLKPKKADSSSLYERAYLVEIYASSRATFWRFAESRCEKNK